jgi:hypothetical protein
VKADVVNRKDVRMVQCRRGTCLLLEALQPLAISRDRFRQHLERDVSSKSAVMSPVDLTHASDTEERAYLVGPEPGAGRKAHGEE